MRPHTVPRFFSLLPCQAVHGGCLDWTVPISVWLFLRKSPTLAPVWCGLVKLCQQQDCWYELEKNLLLTSACTAAAIREACARTGLPWKSVNSSTAWEQLKKSKKEMKPSGEWELGAGIGRPFAKLRTSCFRRKLWLKHLQAVLCQQHC